jgi:hypothetical protein
MESLSELDYLVLYTKLSSCLWAHKSGRAGSTDRSTGLLVGRARLSRTAGRWGPMVTHVSHQNLCRIDLKARSPVAAPGPDYIRPPHGPGACHTCFSKENQVHNYMHPRIKFHAYSWHKWTTETISRQEKGRLSEFTLNPGKRRLQTSQAVDWGLRTPSTSNIFKTTSSHLPLSEQHCL